MGRPESLGIGRRSPVVPGAVPQPSVRSQRPGAWADLCLLMVTARQRLAALLLASVLHTRGKSSCSLSPAFLTFVFGYFFNNVLGWCLYMLLACGRSKMVFAAALPRWQRCSVTGRERTIKVFGYKWTYKLLISALVVCLLQYGLPVLKQTPQGCSRGRDYS